MIMLGGYMDTMREEQSIEDDTRKELILSRFSH